MILNIYFMLCGLIKQKATTVKLINRTVVLILLFVSFFACSENDEFTDSGDNLPGKILIRNSISAPMFVSAGVFSDTLQPGKEITIEKNEDSPVLEVNVWSLVYYAAYNPNIIFPTGACTDIVRVGDSIHIAKRLEFPSKGTTEFNIEVPASHYLLKVKNNHSNTTSSFFELNYGLPNVKKYSFLSTIEECRYTKNMYTQISNNGVEFPVGFFQVTSPTAFRFQYYFGIGTWWLFQGVEISGGSTLVLILLD